MSQAVKLWNFHGGIHPPERKTVANQTKIAQVTLPSTLYIPLKQHIGAVGEVIVSIGERVLRGQPLVKPGIYGGLPIHAPTSGIVRAISEHPSNHPSAIPVPTITIDVDGKHECVNFEALTNPLNADQHLLLEHIRDAGIAGLGGAGFPTDQKIRQTQAIELLIINGVECEPYIVSDDRLMREHAREIVSGTCVLHYLLNAPRVIIAIEDNKPEAIAAVQEAVQQASAAIEIVVIPTKYPSGGEKQLIQILTGKEVPADGYPADIGILMHNTGTAFAIHQAVYLGEPLMERVVTLTGDALAQPGTTWALLGTPISHLLSQAQLEPESGQRVIVGGPMMGYTIPNTDIPVIKTTNCILCPTLSELAPTNNEMPCIRCGHCEQVCPASLLPQQLLWYAKDHDHEALTEHHLADCIECGACAYVCPSEIPLVHYYRKAKAEIRESVIEQKKAEIARQRFEARQARLEREKQERLERHKKGSRSAQRSACGKG